MCFLLVLCSWHDNWGLGHLGMLGCMFILMYCQNSLCRGPRDLYVVSKWLYYIPLKLFLNVLLTKLSQKIFFMNLQLSAFYYFYFVYFSGCLTSSMITKFGVKICLLKNTIKQIQMDSKLEFWGQFKPITLKKIHKKNYNGHMVAVSIILAYEN